MTGLTLDLVSKATLILFAACGLAALMRRASAAARHVVWAAAFAALLVLPAARAVLPALHVPVLPPAAASGQRPPREASVLATDAPAAMPSADRTTAPIASGGAATDGHRDWVRAMTLALGTIWIFGVGALLWRGLTSAGALRRVTRAAEGAVAPELARRVETISSRFGVRRRVRVIVSSDPVMPVTWGIARPVLLLPAAALDWRTQRPSRLDAVLIHELAHVARWDALSNALGQIAVTLLWFHPLAWHAARRARLERERACDDVVVSTGVRAADYASDLVTLARTLAFPAPEMAGALNMVRPSNLEARVDALLDTRVNRRRASRVALMVAMAGTLAVAPFGSARLSARAALSTPVVAAPVPREDSNATGESLRDTTAVTHHTRSLTPPRIPASATALQIQRPMAPALAELLTEALSLPGIIDVLRVTAAQSGPVSPPVTEQPIADPYRAPGTTAPKIDMSGVVEPKRQQAITPIYPQSAIDAGIQGSCTAEAIIDHEGQIIDAHVVSGGAPALNAATLDAVRQWRYSPALINGDPKAILLTLTVRYQLK